jgi:Acetyltransferase (GNAT) domain
MQEHISQSQVPTDHNYYRSVSPMYASYLKHCHSAPLYIPGTKTFGWLRHQFGKLFTVVKYDRIDVVPDLKLLRDAGFRRGFIIWVPFRNLQHPGKGWGRLFLPTHFVETGFTTLTQAFREHWNSRAKRAEKKFAQSGAVVRAALPPEFIAAFRATRVRYPFKEVFVDYYRFAATQHPEVLRSWVVEHKGEIVAWLAVCDYEEHSSVHMVSYLSDAGRDIQAGTGLIAEWFRESAEKGMKYINFDHLQEDALQFWQRGYTDFKLNFMQYRVSVKPSFIRFIWNIDATIEREGR